MGREGGKDRNRVAEANRQTERETLLMIWLGLL